METETQKHSQNLKSHDHFGCQKNSKQGTLIPYSLLEGDRKCFHDLYFDDLCFSFKNPLTLCIDCHN